MAIDNAHLENTCKQFVESLLNGKRSVLCLNIAEPTFSAEETVVSILKSLGTTEVSFTNEPTPTRFGEILSNLKGQVAVVNFDDLDKSPKCLDLLAQHVQQPDPGGKLVVVSRHWNSDNTAKERDLRKFALFYQQNLEAKRKA